ncbi:MAG: RteC domain-containing protein [Mangrovibacterium sp.]
MDINTPEHITEKLKTNLQQFESNENRDIIELERAVGICSSALLELREYVNRHDFKTREEEIHFFKVTKPDVLKEYLYYSRILQMESRHPDPLPKDRKKYLKKMMEEAKRYYHDFPEFYRYYRSGSDHLDDKYFVRTQISCYLNCERFIMDPCFSTSHDYTLAAMKAFEKISEYCRTELKKLKSGQPFISKDGTVEIKSSHKWTGSLRALVELIYGVHSTGVIDDGRISIKKLIEIFEALLNVKLGDYYHTWNEIRGRKISRTPFLDLMIKCLLKRMDDADEK